VSSSTNKKKAGDCQPFLKIFLKNFLEQVFNSTNHDQDFIQLPS